MKKEEEIMKKNWKKTLAAAGMGMALAAHEVEGKTEEDIRCNGNER